MKVAFLEEKNEAVSTTRRDSGTRGGLTATATSDERQKITCGKKKKEKEETMERVVYRKRWR